jgi:lipopolysaccharide assembly protein A
MVFASARTMNSRRSALRWINLAAVAIFAATLLFFAAQNFQTVTVYFLTLKMSAPHAVLIVVIYILGMVTGNGLGALVRQAFEGARSI